MIVVRRTFALSSMLSRLIRPTSTISDSDCFVFTPKITVEQQQIVLDTLNTSDSEQLLRFRIPKTRIRKLESWRDKKGPFQSLSDILEVEGLSVKVLEKLCRTILTTKDDEDDSTVKATNCINLKNILSPSISNIDIIGLNSAVGIHLEPTGVSWAKITRNGNILCDWNFYDFRSLPAKILPSDSFDLAVQVLNALPPADFYVLEAPIKSQKKPAVFPAYTQQAELSSMLIALINTSPRHNSFIKQRDSDENVQFINKVYYLKPHLPARLFQTLVGHEKVSTNSTLQNILDNKSSSSLPCSAVNIDTLLKQEYFSNSSPNRHLLGEALLLIITFMDVCVYKNPATFNALGRKKSKQ